MRRQVLTADPEDNPAHRQPNVMRYVRKQGGDYLSNRQLRETQLWYVAAEGGFRSDISNLTESFNGLVSSTTLTKSFWSILLGYTYHTVWSVETGYTHSPVQLNITLANSPQPFVFNYQNVGNGIPIRIKRRLGSAKQAANSSGLWLTAGAWLIPNVGQQLDDLVFTGYSTRGRNRLDSIRLDMTTTSSSQITGLAEAGFDYTTRISSFLELGLYLRKYWGLGNALRSDLTYKVNSGAGQPASVTSNGTGWGFGLALRYIYGRQHEVKKTALLVP